jgi:aryl-alcohol dehydrogenase-like predicted oxidoreductase
MLQSLAVPLGIGTMMWGNSPLDPFISGRVLPNDVLAGIVSEALAHGVTFFDTAEGYGGGTSESQVAVAVRLATSGPTAAPRLDRWPLLVATKFLPTLWRWTEQSFINALDGSNQRLGVTCCPVYFIHSPIHPLPIEVWISAASKAIQQGKMKALGLSNFRSDQVLRAVKHAKLLGNVTIVANQIMCNLLVINSPELQRTLAVCREHNITVVAFSPVGQGLLCDGLTAEKAAGIRLMRITGVTHAELASVRDVLQSIAGDRKKTMSQVAVNYLLCKGMVPLVGARRVEHVRDAVGGVAGWRLEPSEVARLDTVALGRHTFEKPRWRRGVFITFISALMLAYRLSLWWRNTLGRLL